MAKFQQPLIEKVIGAGGALFFGLLISYGIYNSDYDYKILWIFIAITFFTTMLISSTTWEIEIDDSFIVFGSFIRRHKYFFDEVKKIIITKNRAKLYLKNGRKIDLHTKMKDHDSFIESMNAFKVRHNL